MPAKRSSQPESARAGQARRGGALKAQEEVEDALREPEAHADESQIDAPDPRRLRIRSRLAEPACSTAAAPCEALHAELLREIGHVLSDVPNRITLEGHTDAQPFSGGERGYSNWELSSDRANASRREIVAGGLPEDRMLLVQGLASSNLFLPAEPTSPMNRRISIIVMTAMRRPPAASCPCPPRPTGARRMLREPPAHALTRCASSCRRFGRWPCRPCFCARWAWHVSSSRRRTALLAASPATFPHDIESDPAASTAVVEKEDGLLHVPLSGRRRRKGIVRACSGAAAASSIRFTQLTSRRRSESCASCPAAFRDDCDGSRRAVPLCHPKDYFGKRPCRRRG